ncbi:membrane-bound lytic murein transglycosylase D [Paraglaciecola mesophila KMM 241]|uniref:Membrane-bound lytic murein transglycosylase D n=1 Tax=Paraglaciecola mesophila KMM 241 TaxID=1128912 RepID=K6YNP9_9ALTE|nr:LysM peptidoglycan-binding domain-containing protein [Paraglaciecola mesophila]GAC25626.1 membrane-bound lytic murein transglycosylase D [Paraglaciecola mesophila KMM 241]
MRLHTLLCLSLVSILPACQMMEPHSETAEQIDQEHEIAQEIATTCEQSGELADKAFDCEAADEGIIPVTHPKEEVEVEIAPEPIPMDVAAADVWQRVSQNLAFEFEDNARIASQRNWYLKHPAYMQRVAKRAKPFLYLIVERLEEENMPLELALLPIVESAFDPFAYSHGRAAGMWQFVPATGKRFGMKQTWWYDGRRDVMASTDGAIAYLRYLNEMFDGNWLHALAAYNSGEGRVARAIKKNKKLGKSTEYWALDLPKETRAYVPKLLALADILRDAEKYSFSWPIIENIKVTEMVDVGSQIDLALAADMAGLSVEALHALNPGYNRWATDPDGPFNLLVPVDKVEKFSEAIAATETKERLNWVRHKIKSGDSLLKLAHKYHTTTDIISQVNELKGNVIRAGEYLVIPVALKSMDFYSLSQDQRLADTQSKHKSGTYQVKHQVKSGDTMWDISRKYKVNMRSLAKWNGMAPTDTLRPGKELVVWLKGKDGKKHSDAVIRTLTYTVRGGDSLARIAQKFKVNVSDLVAWNQISTQKYLQPGQKLKIKVDVTRT